jgi:rubrerythrin
MLKVDREIIQGVYACTSGEELQQYLQNAIELEHATIPPYLTAMYSLVPGLNDEIGKLIRSIVIEEMLHMTIAANILVAIGGSPQINNPEFVPKYPGTLPMGIGDDLVVPIKAFSKSLVKDVFMKIEEPEHPVPIRLKAFAAEEFGTIGQFYEAIQKKITQLGDSIFVVGPDQQVLSWFDDERLFAIVDVKTANDAIDVIVTEGEGTSTDPFDSDGEPAHFYRFGEIYYGRKLIKTPGGFAYAGDVVWFNQSGVYPMIDNPRQSDYQPDSHVATLSRNFTAAYTNLLNRLQKCFNGEPQTIDMAIGLMYQMRLSALALMSTPVREGSTQTAGPVYEYRSAQVSEPKPKQPVVFPTYGVHNPPEFSPCKYADCIYPRGPGEPSNPLYPEYWTAKWTMYRVYNQFAEYPPPYDGKPPAPLKEGVDYQVSYGATYYDSTWRGPRGEQGAMMEHYEDWSLPIFPIPNNYSSSFISLGDTAYFITYDKDRPAGMPPICLFSDINHPPRRDFIKHLPYSAGDSQRLDGRVQGYSFWTSRQPNEPPIQVGVSPDRTADGAIMFGYAFYSNWEPDAVDKSAEPYRHPHSFYFSGYGDKDHPPNAPIVSQNYTEFSMTKPNPAETWDLVAKLSAGQPLPRCNLFSPPGADAMVACEMPSWVGARPK